MRYLKGTPEKLAVFLSKGGLREPCQPQPAALTGPAFTDQAESCSADFQIVTDLQLLMGFAVAEIPHEQGNTVTVHFFLSQ